MKFDDAMAAEVGTLKAVKVSIPAKVAFDLTAMQKVTKDVLGRLGCPECHSGFDIRFGLENRFRVDEKLNVIADFGPAI